MNAEQKRLADALDRLDITHNRLSGLVLALEHLLDDSSAWPSNDNPVVPAIFAVRAVVEEYTKRAENDTRAAWGAAKAILDFGVVHHA